ncbi:hypothetical protein [Macrococcus sp. DPC7161]|uniref:immunodominant staphylococcal antigen IsaB family protein n=1 Tax=Macrococcus sp. DPC7161 TaxID=2507060 RepID=UPI00100B01A0|nr:hypothetical protein [Macrococcus sp. DPC7161]RXK17390.1 hypothetical protein ER639_10420 [Macrococcus sp. DPC7161]
MKHFKLIVLALLIMITVIQPTQVNAAGYYYKWKGHSGNSYQYVTTKAFVNAVKKGRVTVNGRTVEKKIKAESLNKSAEVILTYAFENKKVKSKYIKRQYDTVIFLNDKYKTYTIEMPVKKGKISKKQFIKTYGKHYSEIQEVENETSIYYKFQNHYFEGIFNKKNQLIGVSFSSHIAGQVGKDVDEFLFGE